MPKRIQRCVGQPLPENTVFVGEPTMYGNPWKEGSTGWTVKPGGWIDREPHPPLTREQAVESFRNSEEHFYADPEALANLRANLAGKDLACWCPEGTPCHADVLLELANAKEPATT